MKNPTQWLAGAVVFALGVVLFFAISRPELHHFDDFAYVYAAGNQSLYALTHGQFESSNVAGFYNAKVGHVVLLKGLVGLFGEGVAAIKSLELVYSLLVVLSAAALAGTLAILQRTSVFKALTIGALFLTVPVTVYFSAKLLAEGAALFWAMLSLLTLAMALREPHRLRWWLCIALSAATLACSVYTRIQLVVLPLGLWIALFACPPGGITRSAVVRATAAVGLMAVALFGLTEWLAHLNLMAGLMTGSVIASQHSYLAEKLMKTAYAFGPFLLALPASLLLIRRNETRFLLVWFVCASAPLLLVFSFVETRWLLVGAPALAGLAYLSLESLWQSLRERHWASPVAAVLLLAVCGASIVSSNRYIQPRTEYGLDEKALQKAKAWIDAHYAGRPILVPWTHSDYHYLSFAYPGQAIYTVNSESFFTPATFIQDAPHWVSAMRRWYGARYVDEYATLKRIDGGPWLAIAWNRAPGAWDGLKTSWVATDPHLHRTLVHREGPYQVYLLEDTASGPAITAN